MIRFLSWRNPRPDAPDTPGHWFTQIPGASGLTAHGRWTAIAEAEDDPEEPLAAAYQSGFEYAVWGSEPDGDGWAADSPAQASSWDADRAAAHAEGHAHGTAVAAVIQP
jgi:hypothetical protein